MKGTLGKKKDKPMDIKLKIAIIAALAAVTAGALQGPFMNSVYQDRPIVDISFGSKDGSSIRRITIRWGKLLRGVCYEK